MYVEKKRKAIMVLRFLFVEMCNDLEPERLFYVIPVDF